MLLKTSPRADWGASRLTVCGVLTAVMLKMARSAAPGGADGLGVGSLLTWDQDAGLFQLEPVPSQTMFAAKATSDESADPMANASNSKPDRVMERIMA